jgi:hypothetical protein
MMTLHITLFSLQQIQLEGLRFEPQLPRLLQAEHKTNPTGDRSCEGLDIKNTVFAEWIITWRSFGEIFMILLMLLGVERVAAKCR